MEDTPDIRGGDIPESYGRATGTVTQGAVPDDEPTLEEKINVLAGVIEYHDEQILEIRAACESMAKVLVRLTQAIDAEAAKSRPSVVLPDGRDISHLSRKQRRDIQFGRGE